MPTILCVDDDIQNLAIRRLLLEARGYRVLAADDPKVGLWWMFPSEKAVRLRTCSLQSSGWSNENRRPPESLVDHLENIRHEPGRVTLTQLGGSYKPGDFVPHTGEYWVQHYAHRGSHLVRLYSGQVFPACRECGQRVRFDSSELSRSEKAPPIERDPDFR